MVKLSKLFGISTDQLLYDEYDLSQKPAKPAAKKPGLSAKAIRLIDEKGYVAGYLLAARCIPELIGCIVICWTYLHVLAGLGPLREFPYQAFFIPMAAALGAAVTIVRMIFYLVLAWKLCRQTEASEKTL